MKKLNTERFSGIFQVPGIYPICVVGAGGIGADTILTAAKMGFTEILVYDDDTVDDVNIATQFHRFSSIGSRKTMAIAYDAVEYAGPFVVPVPELMTADTILPFSVEVVVSAVDSIKARQDIWVACRGNYLLGNGPHWYIDSRMASMEFHMFVIDMSDTRVANAYEAELLGLREEDVEDLPCTEKATPFLAKIASGHIGAELMHIVKEEAVSRMLIHNVNTQFMYKSKL